MRRSKRPRRRAERIFLDANVLYSAAYMEQSRLADLWRFASLELLSSAFTVEEARRNIAHDLPETMAQLARLLETVQIVPEPSQFALPEPLDLIEKDRPVLTAALHAGSDYLLTGDRTHFGDFYRKNLLGVMVLPPADYFEIRKRG